jgi:molybdopterin-guanine dinucleotide biosynthesis protein A
VVLAGGESRRMGRDKLPLEVGGSSLVSRCVEVLSSRCEEVLLVGSGAPEYEGLRAVPDLRPDREGPLAGIEAGLAAARNRPVLVAAGDMPFIPAELVGFLLDLLTEKGVPAAVPVYGGRPHPLCAAYDREILPLVRAALDDGVRAVRVFLGTLDGVEYVEGRDLRRFGDPDLFLMNVNSREDLERARAAAREG